MIKYDNIETFFSNTKFAVAGVSRNNKKFGNMVYNTLKEKNFTVYPINPNMESVEGEKCFKTPLDLPTSELSLIVVAPKEQTMQIVKDAVQKGIKNVWLQYGTNTEEAIEYGEKSGVNIIYKQCVMMFLNPVGIHKFHAVIHKLFGKYPK